MRMHIQSFNRIPTMHTHTNLVLLLCRWERTKRNCLQSACHKSKCDGNNRVRSERTLNCIPRVFCILWRQRRRWLRWHRNEFKHCNEYENRMWRSFTNETTRRQKQRWLRQRVTTTKAMTEKPHGNTGKYVNKANATTTALMN